MTGAADDTLIRAFVRLIRAQRTVLGSVEAELKAKGIPPLAWYDVMLELDRAGREGGLRPFELEREMLLEQYNLSRLVDRLVAAGYVERRPCPGDGRGQMLALTESGREMRRRVWPIYSAAVARHLGSRLGPAEAELLAALLGKLADADKPCS
jgi:DNA-binding MarR family transcriptional regulator